VRATPKCVVEVTRRPIGIAGGKVGRGQRAANAHWIPFLWVKLKAAALINYAPILGVMPERVKWESWGRVGRE